MNGLARVNAFPSGPDLKFEAYGTLPDAPEQGRQMQEQPSYFKLALRSAGVSGEAIWY